MSDGVSVVEVVEGVELGEGPHWDPLDQSLLFVDMPKGDIIRYFPATGRRQVLHVEDAGFGPSVSLVVPVEGAPDLFVVGLGRSLAVVQWSPSDPDRHTVKAKVVLHTVDDHAPKNRFNDGKCDPQGRLWAGTMGPIDNAKLEFERNKSSLFRLDNDLKLSTRVTEVTVSNGLAWSLDNSTFYYIDSVTQTVEAFTYDDITGEISERQQVVNYKALAPANTFPDGMCIDNDGNLWVASFGGGKVMCANPHTGKVVREVKLPTSKITSVCWGGQDLDTLYVTSTTQGLRQEDLAAQPHAGNTFAVTGLGAKGLPATNFKTNLENLKARFTA